VVILHAIKAISHLYVRNLVSIHCIDGVNVHSHVDELGLNPFKKEAWVKTADDIFDIEPGKRIIDVMLERNEGFAIGRVVFIAEPGKTYRVMGNVGEKEGGFWTGVQKVHFFIEDDQT